MFIKENSIYYTRISKCVKYNFITKECEEYLGNIFKFKNNSRHYRLNKLSEISWKIILTIGRTNVNESLRESLRFV